MRGTAPGLIAVAALACGPGPAEQAAPPPTLSHETAESLRLRAVSGFARGFLAKPGGDRENEPAFALAPLLIEAVTGAVGGEPRLGLGTPEQNADGSLVVRTGRPAVYFGRSTTTIGGHPLERVSYTWWRSASPADGPVDGLQGIRMTLDEGGSPFLWEVLVDSSGARLLFVDRSLEEAASEELGPPHPGREFSVERGLDETPQTLVVRVIEAGPVPLGPFVHLGERGADVHTLLCRCMPSEVEEIVGQAEYALLPIGELAGSGLESGWDEASPEAWLRWPPSWSAAD